MATRRAFLRTSCVGLGLATAAAAGCATMTGNVASKTKRRVVVIGGGWGGATAAKYVRLGDPSIEVVLLEPNREFVSCPLSNLVLSGVRTIESLTRGYDGLRAHGVRIVHAEASAIEPDRRRVRVGKGYLEYDRLIVSPGVELQWDRIDGLAAAKETVLHAWTAGPQTVALARQIQSMPDGGVFVLSIPLAAYRCPAAPYERACQVAWYLRVNKPRSKVIVLDANPDIISEPGLFRAAWTMYPAIDYRPSSQVTKVDLSMREVTTDFGDSVRYDVANIIPPQRAGTIAVQADLAGGDRRWCEVNHITYESVKHNCIHVIGDATIGIPTPKSGTVANAMGKIAASAVVHLLNDKEPPATAPVNACYSWVSGDEAIAVSNAYRIQDGTVVQVEQKLTPGPSAAIARDAVNWATFIWNDILG